MEANSPNARTMKRKWSKRNGMAAFLVKKRLLCCCQVNRHSMSSLAVTGSITHGAAFKLLSRWGGIGCDLESWAVRG